jgi:hypothetical protein
MLAETISPARHPSHLSLHRPKRIADSIQSILHRLKAPIDSLKALI